MPPADASAFSKTARNGSREAAKAQRSFGRAPAHDLPARRTQF
jgi:hypothetical protein